MRYMRYMLMAVVLLAAGFLFGCGAKQDPRPDQPQNSKSSNVGTPKVTPADSPEGEVDIADLPKGGPGDPALTYGVVSADPVKHRGKRVTWAYVPLSAEGARMMCALDEKEALGPRHAGIYVIEFASDREAGDAFHAAAFNPGSTVTGTLAGQVDQFLVVRGPDGAPQKDIPKVTVPLLAYPAYETSEPAVGKGKS